MDTKPKRRWYQFSLRTMFVVVTLACIGFGWWVQRSREWIRQRRQVLSVADGERHPDAVVIGREVTAPGFLWVFGEGGVGQLYVDRYGRRTSVATIERLFPEADV